MIETKDAADHATPCGSAASPSLRRELTEATRQLDQAEARRRPVDMSLALLRVGRCHRDLGSLDGAEWYLQRGLSWARTLGAPDLAIEILSELAGVCALQASLGPGGDRLRAHAARERSRDFSHEASALAARHCDPPREATVLQRVSAALELCGDREDSSRLRCRLAQLGHREAAEPA